MINVLHYGLSKNRGGIETYLYKISKYVNREQFRFSFIDTNDGCAALREELVSLGCVFHDVTHRRISRKKNKRDLEKLFSIGRFDIFHCHVNTLSYILPIQIAIDSGCKVIVHSRNAGATYALHTIFLHYLHRFTLPKRGITKIAVSAEAGRWLFGSGSGYNIYNNGVEIERFKFRQSIRDRLRQEWKLEGKTVIGVVGAFLPAKNYKFVINVFKKLKSMEPKAFLLLVGDGPLRAEIEAECKARDMKDVMFLGSRNDVDHIYNAMDIFFMPSIFEGFPNACLEAQTNGLPCIVSDAITKEVDATNLKYLSLDEGDEKWASSIRCIDLRGGADRSSMAEVVKEKGFSVEKEVRRLEQLYFQVLEGG